MIQLLLSQGLVAIIDDEDADLAEFKWSTVTCRKVKYAHRKVWIGGKRCSVYLHRVIAERKIGEIPPKTKIDHKNTNSFDNRRLNLRVATHRENLLNRGPDVDSKTGLKGVYGHQGRWFGNIKTKLGTRTSEAFDSAESAARWYDDMALKEHGEFAWLNFPVTANDTAI